MVERLAKAWLGVAAILLIVAVPTVFTSGAHALTERFLREQDLPVLLAIAAAAAATRLFPGLGARLATACDTFAPAVDRLAAFGRRPAAVWVLAALVGLCATAGVWIVFADYPLSMDEFMATFAAAIHVHGKLVASVAPAWRDFVGALQPEFMSYTPGGAAWAPLYLPANAALLALGRLVGAPEVVEPALAAFSIVAVWAIARRLWPERPAAPMVAAVLLATSSQFLLTAMTPYAMTAHLAFNLAWLWLFLRGGRLGHAGALAVGFVACGLHELVFHPLFVAPFIAQAWLDRRWRVAALYTIAYAGICLVWIEFWPLAVALSGAAPAGHAAAVSSPAAAGAVGGFGAHVIALVSGFSLSGFGLMAENLLRFAVWQNPLLTVLLVVGAMGAARARGTMRSLLAGLILATVAMLILLPYQGHGWGYRYLHGFLGSAALIAARAWMDLADGLAPARRPGARVGFAAAAAVAVLVLLPLHAWQARAFAAPYARAEAAIRRAGTDIVLLDENQSWFTLDLIRNDPWLRNRPLVLRLGSLTDAQVDRLCAGATVSVFNSRVAGRHGIRVFAADKDDAPALARLARVERLACGPARLPVREVD